jgi:hypothetical protein
LTQLLIAAIIIVVFCWGKLINLYAHLLSNNGLKIGNAVVKVVITVSEVTHA